MGQDAAEIERSITEQRQYISRQVGHLRGRVQDDIQAVRGRAQEQANLTIEEAKQFLDVEQQMQEHPYSALAGALGLGVVLGIASEGLPSGKSNGSAGNGYGYSGDSRNGGRSGLGEVVSSIVNVAGETFQDEIRQLIREAMESIKPKSRPTEDAQAP